VLKTLILSSPQISDYAIVAFVTLYGLLDLYLCFQHVFKVSVDFDLRELKHEENGHEQPGNNGQLRVINGKIGQFSKHFFLLLAL